MNLTIGSSSYFSTSKRTFALQTYTERTLGVPPLYKLQPTDSLPSYDRPQRRGKQEMCLDPESVFVSE